MTSLEVRLDAFVPRSEEERGDLARIRSLLAGEGDPWTRKAPLHITGSAVIVHPPTRRVLLRWHERMQGWLQVGGHADPGETDPYVTALREAEEETGLHDLSPWPDEAVPQVVQVAIVPVPAGRGEPPHEHADVRFGLSTRQPESVQPESEKAQLRWLSVDAAIEAAGEDNLRECLTRLAEHFT